ncbi:MAG: SDR family NAD(P)-dependent oxidoreductase, partial [Mycetocola sp.]
MSSGMEAFRYDGKRTVVVGAATGMGAAVVELVKEAGAEVVAMDRVDMSDPGLTFVRVDLSDKQSIENAVGECGGGVDALFACAGVADGVPGIERINFLGHRHMIDSMLGQGLLARGAAIGFISSAAGLGWDQGDLPALLEYVAMDFDAAASWAVSNEKATYQWSKRAINTYVAHEALPLLKQGIRINAT